jgi:hypothetical protein
LTKQSIERKTDVLSVLAFKGPKAASTILGYDRFIDKVEATI